MRFLAVFCILFLVVQSYAQNTDSQNQLALMYFTRGDYVRAVDIYEELYAQSRSHVHFENLVVCYRKLQQYDKAEQVIQNQIKAQPHSIYYSVSLLQLYVETKRERDAANLHRRVQRQALRTEQQAIEAIQAYITLGLFEMGEGFIESAKKQYSESVDITKVLLDLYSRTGQYSKLVKESVTLVIQDSYEREYVENTLQFIVFEEQNNALSRELHATIQQALQRNANNIALHELYIWLHIQENNFQQAFSLSRALDIRLKENGERVFQLGKIAQSNKQYTIATQSFSYVLAKGPTEAFYAAALTALLETANEELFSSHTVTQKSIEDLEAKYVKAIKDLGVTNQTVPVVRALAHLQAFYLNKIDEAKKILEELIELPRIGAFDKALTEMLLADILVFEGDVWLANLLYAKIALAYRNNDVGHEARFKQAQLAYYNGQFAYAQALLDGIKASSSKLIANDALELAQLIADNTVHDPESSILTQFALADLRIYQKQYHTAFALLDTLQKKYPTHALQAFILMRKAEIAEKMGDVDTRITYLTQVAQDFAHDIPAHKAHYFLAVHYDYEVQNKELAKKHYYEIVVNHPTSFYIHEARKRYRELLVK